MIIILSILANIWVHWVFNPIKIKYLIKFKNSPARYKPIDCEQCLSFWITAIYYLKTATYWDAALWSGLAYLLGGLISRLFTTYLNKYYARAIKRFF